MICNVSRLQTFLECRQKDQYLWEDHLIPNRTPTPLLTGGAVHKGLEVFFKTSNAEQALTELEENYRERLGEMSFILPEESVIYEREIKFSKLAFELWAKKYKEFGFEVLYPEVSFVVPLPGSEHHCYWMHKLLHPETPNWPRTDTPGLGALPCNDKRCVMPHYLKGRADGVVSRAGKIWLLETKTATATGNPWYDQWYLDMQPTAYIWGLRQSLGIRVNGFLMNVIKKPNHNYKGSLEDFFSKDPFEQEAFIRTDEDLDRFQREIRMMFDERESAHRDGRIFMSPRRATCVAYNRRCSFFDLCQRHGEKHQGEFMQKPLDYVEEEYYKMAGLAVPEQPKNMPPMYEEAES